MIANPVFPLDPELLEGPPSRSVERRSLAFLWAARGELFFSDPY
jgi:hypothetical protein